MLDRIIGKWVFDFIFCWFVIFEIFSMNVFDEILFEDIVDVLCFVDREDVLVGINRFICGMKDYGVIRMSGYLVCDVVDFVFEDDLGI